MVKHVSSIFRPPDFKSQTGCVILGKVLNISMPQMSKDLLNQLVQWLRHSKYPLNAIY